MAIRLPPYEHITGLDASERARAAAHVVRWVISALIVADGRSAWRTLAIGADAGLVDAARALGAVADLDACGALSRAGRVHRGELPCAR